MDSQLSDIGKVTQKIDGWLTIKEGELLYNLAKNSQGKGSIVEIGSWKGKSTVWLANGSKAGKKIKIHAIDPHIGSAEQQRVYGKLWTFKDFKKNIKIAKINELVTPIVKTSQDAAKDFRNPVEVIFIDGAHDYNFVKLDFELWFPKVILGGMMAFHDTIRMPGPRKLVREKVYKSRNFRNIKFIDSITVAEKVAQNNFNDRIKNRYVLMLKDIYWMADKLKLPAHIRNFGKKIVRLLQSN